MVLLSERFFTLLKAVQDVVDTLQIVLGKNLKLLNGLKELYKLCDTSTEKIKSSKDLIW